MFKPIILFIVCFIFFINKTIAAPTANTDTIYSICNSTGFVNLLANDTDYNGYNIYFVSLLGTTGVPGTLYITGGNTLNFTPTPGNISITTIKYIIKNNASPVKYDTANIVLISQGCNLPPVAVNDLLFTPCNTTVNLNPLINDSDPNIGQLLNYSIISSPKKGSITSAGGVQLAYSPNLCSSGLDTIVYELSDNGTPILKDTGLIIINIASCICNTPPKAYPDTASILCNGTVTLNPILNDVDTNAGQILYLSGIVKNGSNGVASYIINTNNITYKPNSCFTGKDTIKYSVCDNGNPTMCDTGYIFITIGACNCTAPTANFTANQTEFCSGDCISFTDLSTQNPTNWVWTFNGATPSTSNAKNPTNICYANAGTYSVTLVAGNSYGNSLPITKINYIKVNPNPISMVIDQIDTLNSYVYLNVNAGSNIVSYSWNPKTNLSSDTVSNPLLYVTGNANYDCQYKNIYGCTGITSFGITTVKGFADQNIISIPNTFTPNNDGLNDVWQIKYKNLKSADITIVNRWGNVVFHTTDMNQAWNGTAKQGIDQNAATYFYYVKAIFKDGEVVEKKGDILVLY